MGSLAGLPLPLIIGVAVGSFYALIALCFHLVFVSASAVNFAQGQIFMYGALVYATLASAGIPAWPSLLVTIVVIAVGSALFALLLFQPLNRPDVPHLALVLVPIAAGGALTALALQLWGNQGLRAPPLIPDRPLQIGSAVIVPQHLIVIALTWLCLLGVWLLLTKTFLGVSIRAVAANQYAARLQGINVTVTVVVIFALTGVISGLGGALIAPLTGATTGIGGVWSLLGVLAAVLGGLTTARGAVLGGVILGLAQQLATFYISSAYAQAIVLFALVAFLIIRPRGLVAATQAGRV
jgi:branched-subunit amino acid ABC-type transport system permease component